jgi:TetR/AcrR family transcriptional regulator, cholesterol catabolism regulator
VGSEATAPAAPAVRDLPPYQAARRQRIIDAAGGLLRERDYEQIQVRDVAAAADLAVGTVYRYFSSKDHLYAAVLQTWGQGFDRASAGPTVRDPLVRLETRMRHVLESFDKRPQYFRALMLLQASTDLSTMALLADFRGSIEGLVEADLRELDPEGAADFAVIVWAVLSNLLTRTRFHDGTMTEAYRIIDLFVEMLRLRFGRG